MNDLFEVPDGESHRDLLVFNESVQERIDEHYPEHPEYRVLYMVRDLVIKYGQNDYRGPKTVWLSPERFFDYYRLLPPRFKFTIPEKVPYPHLYNNLGYGNLTSYRHTLKGDEVIVVMAGEHQLLEEE